MKNLGIQLTRNGHSTTRRPRWVVWILGMTLLFLFSMFLTGLWITRSQLLIAAPTHTEIVIELNTSTHHVSKLLSLLDAVPLISNRTLELRDLLPYTNGALALFVMEDGTRAVALKTTKNTLPKDFLDSQRIVVQAVGNHVVLLSEKLLPLTPVNAPFDYRGLLPDLLNRTIGRLTLIDEQATGSLVLTQDFLSVRLSNLSFTGLDHSFPKDTFAFLSTQALTKTNLQQIYSSSEYTKDLTSLFSDDSWVFLTKQEQDGFIIWSPTAQTFDRQGFLRRISANLNPTIKPKLLVDGTVMEEITLDPDKSSIEEVTILGQTFLHARSQKGEEFFLSSTDELIFSNNEMNIRSFLEKNKEKRTSICHGNFLGTEFEYLLLKEQKEATSYSPSVLRQISAKFQSIGLTTHRNSLEITLCS